jgi:hypothetical protein
VGGDAGHPDFLSGVWAGGQAKEVLGESAVWGTLLLDPAFGRRAAGRADYRRHGECRQQEKCRMDGGQQCQRDGEPN